LLPIVRYDTIIWAIVLFTDIVSFNRFSNIIYSMVVYNLLI